MKDTCCPAQIQSDEVRILVDFPGAYDDSPAHFLDKVLPQLPKVVQVRSNVSFTLFRLLVLLLNLLVPVEEFSRSR